MRSTTRQRLLGHIGALLLGCAALAARATPVTTTDVTGAPGQPVDVVFDIDFGTLTQMSSFQFSLDWDPTLLSLTGASVTQGGTPFDALSALSSNGLLSTATSGNPQLTATWFAIDPATFAQLPPLALTGSVRLDFSFDLARDFPAGASSPVALSLVWSDENGFQPIDPQVEATALVSTASIPETPTAWLVLMALALLVRSRTGPRSHAG